MNAIDLYFDEISRILAQVLDTQRDAVELAAAELAAANEEGRNIFVFGCSHAGLLATELFYRTGGMATINPIRAPGMMCEISPITMTSELERLPGYGSLILRNTPAAAGDLLIIHSVSGRNAVSIDMAQTAAELGMKIIVLTNMATSSSVESRHPSGKKLYEFADILIDNCGAKGDAALSLPGLAERTAPTSTAVGAAILNAVAARAAELMLEHGAEPPVFVSANIDGGDEHNKKMLDKYKNHIFYM